MEKSHVSVLLRRNSDIQKGNLLLLFLAAVFLTSLTVGSTSSAALRSFQSPISPVSPVIGPPESAAGPAVAPTPQPAASAVPPSAASTPVLWIVIGLVVVGTFVVGLVFFQKRRE